MVSAIRIGMVGGRFTTKDGEEVSVDGIMQDAFAQTGQGSFTKFLDGIDTIIKPAFPDGMHINSVLRVVNNDSRYQENNIPFVVASGNTDDAYRVNVNIDTPSIYFDPATLDLTNTDTTKSDQTQLDKFNESKEIVAGELISIEQTTNGYFPMSMLDRFLRAYENIENLEGLTVEQFHEKMMNSIGEILMNYVTQQGDNVYESSGVDFAIVDFKDGKLITKPLKEMAKVEAINYLQSEGYPVTNINVYYSVRNAPGSTDKIREFNITDAENNKLIGTFVYDQNQFIPTGFRIESQNDLNSVSQAFAGSPLEQTYNDLLAMINDPSLAPIDEVALGLMVTKYYKPLLTDLKKRGLNSEKELLQVAYKDLLSKIKC